jgi:molybdopterin converting factor small subunit
MQVTVRYVAMLRERRGLDTEVVHVDDGTTVGALYERLFPAPAVPVGFAVDHRQVRADHVLSEGSQVVFLPPVGGG